MPSSASATTAIYTLSLHDALPIFFGTSLFALRLPLVLFFIGFLISMFYLVRLLYSEKFALATVILLGLGSPDVLFLQLRASGEYPRSEERRVGKECRFLSDDYRSG